MPGRALKIAGLTLMGLYTLFWLAMLFGNAMIDPGGLKGFLMMLAPTAAFAALAVIVWRRPQLAAGSLIPLGAIGLGYHALFALQVLDPEIEGPGAEPWILLLAFLPIPVFIISSLYAWKRPMRGGAFMAILGVLLTMARPVPGAFMAAPAVIAGALFLGAGSRSRGPAPSGGETERRQAPRGRRAA